MADSDYPALGFDPAIGNVSSVLDLAQQIGQQGDRSTVTGRQPAHPSSGYQIAGCPRRHLVGSTLVAGRRWQKCCCPLAAGLPLD
jgi:hypothetical protein